MPSRTVHCSICGKSVSGYNFEQRMSKLRRHRKKYHPTAHRKSVKKMVATKRRKAGNPKLSKFRYSEPRDRIQSIACDVCKKAISKGEVAAIYQTKSGLYTFHIKCWNRVIKERGQWIL